MRPPIFGGWLPLQARSKSYSALCKQHDAMEGETTPPTPMATASCKPCQVTPEAPYQTLEYKEIVQQIMEKDSKRSLCLTCQKNSMAKVNDDDTGKRSSCSFYKHESALIDAADHEMKNPKKEYKDKKEQGARLACYKLWTMLEVGRLGRSRRKPLPVCVEARIKLMKPSETFQGYQEKDKEERKECSSSDDDDTWVGTIFNSPLGSYKKPRIT